MKAIKLYTILDWENKQKKKKNIYKTRFYILPITQFKLVDISLDFYHLYFYEKKDYIKCPGKKKALSKTLKTADLNKGLFLANYIKCKKLWDLQKVQCHTLAELLKSKNEICTNIQSTHTS